MNETLRRIKEQATSYTWNGNGVTEELDEDLFAELLVKMCAYLVNDQQRTTGYTDHARMLCREFGIEFREEDYYGDK